MNQKINSVHLESLKNFNLNINYDIIDKMDLIRELSSLVFSIRKENNIQLKIPISEVTLYKIDKSFVFENDLLNILQDEINTKKITIREDSFDEIASKKINLNFELCGKQFREKIKDIINLIKSENYVILENKNLFLKDINLEIDKSLFTVIYSPRNDKIAVKSSADEKILITANIILTQDLIIEGFARQVIRAIQNLRKEKDMILDERIKQIIITSGIENLNELLFKYLKNIKNSTLSNEIIFMYKKDHAADKIENLNNVDFFIEK